MIGRLELQTVYDRVWSVLHLYRSPAKECVVVPCRIKVTLFSRSGALCLCTGLSGEYRSKYTPIWGMLFILSGSQSVLDMERLELNLSRSTELNCSGFRPNLPKATAAHSKMEAVMPKGVIF